MRGHARWEGLVLTLGVVEVVERVDVLLKFCERRRGGLPVQVAVQGLVEAFVLALGGGFARLAGDRSTPRERK